jgi:hypothetical protein
MSAHVDDEPPYRRASPLDRAATPSFLAVVRSVEVNNATQASGVNPPIYWAARPPAATMS